MGRGKSKGGDGWQEDWATWIRQPRTACPCCAVALNLPLLLPAPLPPPPLGRPAAALADGAARGGQHRRRRAGGHHPAGHQAHAGEHENGGCAAVRLSLRSPDVFVYSLLRMLTYAHHPSHMPHASTPPTLSSPFSPTERALLLHRPDARRVLLAPLCAGRVSLHPLHLAHPVRPRGRSRPAHAAATAGCHIAAAATAAAVGQQQRVARA